MEEQKSRTTQQKTASIDPSAQNRRKFHENTETRRPLKTSPWLEKIDLEDHKILHYNQRSWSPHSYCSTSAQTRNAVTWPSYHLFHLQEESETDSSYCRLSYI